MSTQAFAVIEAAVASGKQIVLFLDYDGVLAEISPLPTSAHIHLACREALLALSPVVRTAVVSGRALSDVSERVGIKDLTYVGNHGYEIAGPDAGYLHDVPTEAKEQLRICKKRLVEMFAGKDGVFVEDKTHSLSVHYRPLAPGDAVVADAAVRTLAATFPALHVTGGSAITEVRTARDWHKGSAVLWLLIHWYGEAWQQSVLPVYLGDDLTDEDAFRSLGEKGVCVRVGQNPSPTLASLRLESVAEVARSLEALRAMLA